MKPHLPTLLLLLSACGGDGEPVPWTWIDVSVRTAPAFDPKLDGAVLDIVVSADGLAEPCDAAVTATHASGVRADLGMLTLGPDAPATVSWDGLADDGFFMDPGEVQIVADLQCSERTQGFGEARTYVVRLGATAVDFGVDGDADQVPLAWHKRGLLQRAIQVLPFSWNEWQQRRPDGALSDLDHDDGEPRTGPAPWRAPDVPPWYDRPREDLPAWNIPVGYVAGGDFSVAFVPGTRAASARTGTAISADGPLLGREALPVLRIVSDDLLPTDEGAWSPGRPASFRSAEPLPDTLGLHTLELTWRFEALQDRTWVELPGSLTTTHDVWILAGPTAVQDGRANGASPSASWIGVLHDLQDAVQDLPADDHGAILDALRQHLHEDPYIRYNPSDSAYSTFQGRYIYWDRIWLDMSDWLDRQEGIDLYCHSMACLLSSQANHLGIDAEYITLTNATHPDNGATFRTWLTRAAGGEEWRRYTFNSHGIVEYDDLVWDAAVDVDDDDDPGNLPARPWTPAGISFEAYMDVLTANDMIIVNRGKCDNY